MTNHLWIWMKKKDYSLLYFVNWQMKCELLDVVMRGVTHLGGASFTVALMVALGFFRSFGWEGLIALATSHLLVHVLKKKYRRLRPYEAYPYLNPPKRPLADGSFPSGHTTAAFSAATSLCLMMPGLAGIVYPAVILVGVSRIYLGFHFPSDVAVGALIGTTFAVMIHAILLWMP
jgi:undecaprenyl-diphosphatase